LRFRVQASVLRVEGVGFMGGVDLEGSHVVREQPTVVPVQRFRGGLVFKAHRRVYHSTLGLIVMKKKTYLSAGR